MAQITVQGYCYDTDGNTPLTIVAAKVVVMNSDGTPINIPTQSATSNGHYTTSYDTILLNADGWITVSFTRDVKNAPTIETDNLSGLVPNVINPQVPG